MSGFGGPQRADVERDERRSWAPAEDADEPERRGKPRCKRRYRLPGTGGAATWPQCPGVIDTNHVCTVCGLPPRDYRSEGVR